MEFQARSFVYKNRVYMPKDSPYIQEILAALHNQGHEGYQKILYRITRDFHWQGMKNHIKDFFFGTCSTY